MFIIKMFKCLKIILVIISVSVIFEAHFHIVIIRPVFYFKVINIITKISQII